MAELKTADVDVTSLRVCFSQLATMLVAGACAAAAFGCSTPHCIALRPLHPLWQFLIWCYGFCPLDNDCRFKPCLLV